MSKSSAETRVLATRPALSEKEINENKRAWKEEMREKEKQIARDEWKWDWR